MISMTGHSTAMLLSYVRDVRADGCLSSPSNAALARSSAPTRWNAARLVRSPTVHGHGGNAPIEADQGRRPQDRKTPAPRWGLCFLLGSRVVQTRLLALARACYRARAKRKVQLAEKA